MHEREFAKMERFLDENADIIDLRGRKAFPGEEWIAKAEAALEQPLPESYKWFLRQYGGGEIGGDAIYSLGGESSAGGGLDLVDRHIAYQKDGVAEPDKVVFCRSDIDGEFAFDYSRFENGECPVCLFEDGGRYARNFFDFLRKRVEDFQA